MSVNEQAYDAMSRHLSRIKDIQNALGLLRLKHKELTDKADRYPLKFDLSGSALDGFSTYRAFLEAELTERSLDIVASAIMRANAELRETVASVKQWSERL